MSWALRVIFLTYPWIFNTGNLPRETSVTLLNAVSRGKKAISHVKSAPCNRTYCIAGSTYFWDTKFCFWCLISITGPPLSQLSAGRGPHANASLSAELGRLQVKVAQYLHKGLAENTHRTYSSAQTVPHILRNRSLHCRSRIGRNSPCLWPF